MEKIPVPEVYPLRFTRKDFDRVPEQDRLVHLMLGQLANDINLLRKQLIFATSGFGEGSEPEHHAAVAQAMLTERMFAGRLNEAYEFMQTAECNRAMKSYDTNLPEEWREARKKLHVYFNVDNLIRRLRHKQAFHMDLGTTREAYAMVPADEPMVDFVTVHQGDCLWGSADILASFAMISLVGAESIAVSLQKISADLIQVGELFSTYIRHAQMAFIERHFPNVKSTLPPIVINGPGLFDVRIPFYCAKPSSVNN
jgi:hypothetical protein